MQNLEMSVMARVKVKVHPVPLITCCAWFIFFRDLALSRFSLSRFCYIIFSAKQTRLSASATRHPAIIYSQIDRSGRWNRWGSVVFRRRSCRFRCVPWRRIPVRFSSENSDNFPSGFDRNIPESIRQKTERNPAPRNITEPVSSNRERMTWVV